MKNRLLTYGFIGIVCVLLLAEAGSSRESTSSWEFYGLTKEELQKKVEAIQLDAPSGVTYTLDKQGTCLSSRHAPIAVCYGHNVAIQQGLSNNGHGPADSSMEDWIWDFEYKNGRIISIRKNSHVPAFEDWFSNEPSMTSTYGWEFFGLTKEELQKKVRALNPKNMFTGGDHIGPRGLIFSLNQAATCLSILSAPESMSWNFEYQDGRIFKVIRKAPVGYEVLKSRSEALSQAISEYSRLLAQAQKDLRKYLNEGAFEYTGRSNKQALLARYFGRVHRCYFQRALVYEENGQHKLSLADYRAAQEDRIEYEKQFSNSLAK